MSFIARFGFKYRAAHHYDLAQKTQIDIYLNRQVVRQGEFLSLHEQVSSFPPSSAGAKT